MNWDAIGAFGEILGAVAVVVSLVYLAKQIQANTKSTALGATSTFLDGFVRLNAPILESKEIAQMYRRGYYELDALDEVEQFQFQIAMVQWFNLWEAMFALHQEELLPPGRWAAIRTQIENVLALPGPSTAWNEVGRHIINANLVAEVDSWLIKEGSKFDAWLKPPKDVRDSEPVGD